MKEKRFKRKKEDLSDIDKITYKDLNKSIITYFKNRPFRYRVYSEKQYSHFICDKKTRNKIQITLEPKDNNIIIYPLNNCKSQTLRDICNGINDVDSSFELIKPYCFFY